MQVVKVRFEILVSGSTDALSRLIAMDNSKAETSVYPLSFAKDDGQKGMIPLFLLST